MLALPLAQIADLEETVKQQEKTILEWKNKHDALEKREAERRVSDQAKHTEEIQFLKRTNSQLKVSSIMRGLHTENALFEVKQNRIRRLMLSVEHGLSG